MTWDKTKPAGNLPVSVGDDAIRLNMDHLEDSIAREHQFPDTFGTTSGRHTLPVVTGAAGLAGITGPVDGMIVGQDDIPVLHQRQASVLVPMLGYAYLSDADRLLLVTGDLPAGFLVLTTDTNIGWIWTGSAWEKRFAGTSPITYDRDESIYEHSPAAADSWEEVEVSAGVAMEVTWTCPATGIWNLTAMARVIVQHNSNYSYTAARLVREYDVGGAGTLTYEDDCPVENRQYFPTAAILKYVWQDTEAVDASTEATKVVAFRAEVACDDNQANVFINGNVASGTGQGPAQGVASKSWIEVKAERVG